MNGKKRATYKTKTKEKHQNRIIHTTLINSEKIDFVMTKHGHFRALEQKKITPKDFAKHLLKIGESEISFHFKKAKKEFPLEKREDVEWDRKIDYTIAVYDTINEVVVILGLHPHLKRVTVITLISKINGVYANVYGAYKLIKEEKEIFEKLPDGIEMKTINI